MSFKARVTIYLREGNLEISSLTRHYQMMYFHECSLHEAIALLARLTSLFDEQFFFFPLPRFDGNVPYVLDWGVFFFLFIFSGPCQGIAFGEIRYLNLFRVW
jgi:hypothetical protein